MTTMKFFEIIIEFAFFKKITLRGFLFLMLFYCGVAVVVLPFVFYFSRERPVLGKYYCYLEVSGKIEDGVAVAEQSKTDRLNSYFTQTGFLIPYHDPFVMDTIRIIKCTRVDVLEYVEDSTIAYVKIRNGWYRPNTQIDNEFVYGYLPVFLLHETCPETCARCVTKE